MTVPQTCTDAARWLPSTDATAEIAETAEMPLRAAKADSSCSKHRSALRAHATSPGSLRSPRFKPRHAAASGRLQA